MKIGEVTLKSIDPNSVVGTDNNKTIVTKHIGNGPDDVAAGDHNHDGQYHEKYFLQRDVFIIDSVDKNNKAVYLTHTPVEVLTLKAQVKNGVNLLKGVDFEITGSTFTWNGYFLENVIDVNDELIIIYRYQ